VIEIRDRLDTCPICPLRTQPAPDTVFAVTLRRGQATLGILCAQVPLAKHIRAEEVALFAEVADDLAYALEHIQAQHEREQALRDLEESQRRLQTLADNLPGAVYRCQNDPDRTMEYISEGCVALTGYAPEDLIANRTVAYGDLIHPDDRSAVWDAVQVALNENGSYEITYRLVRRQGDVRDVWERGRGVRDHQGTLVALEGFCTNVTERMEALRHIEELSHFPEQDPSPVLRIAADGRILYANEAAQSLLSAPQEADAQPDWLARVSEALADGSPIQDEIVLGERRYLLQYVPTVEYDYVNIYGMDISRRHRLAEQLNQARKVQAVGQLAGGIAHDFNNLLTVINGHAEMLIGDLEDQPALRADAETILAAGRRAAMLTQQLLAFSRKQLMQMEVLHLNEIVTDIGKILPRVLRENIAMRMDLQADPDLIRSDAGQLGQVIMNLAINARDAMPHGGALTISTWNAHLDTAYARQYGEVAPGDYVLLVVEDNGEGMTDEVKAHLFEPFFTTKPVGQGTGLGLSQVYGIVKQSRGHIHVYSEVGQGTVFRIYLPLVADADVTPERNEAPPEQSASRSHTETILVVEDEEAVRELTARMLRMLGYRTLEASGVQDAARLAQERGQALDLLLCDVVMRDGTGPECVAAVREAHPDIAVIYMSGYTDNSIAQSGVLDEGVILVSKPFNAKTLGAVIRRALDKL